MRWAALALIAILGGCAVKGYDLGWRTADRLTPLLGSPGDALSGCRVQEGRAGAPLCQDTARDIGALVGALPPTPDAPVSLGFRCSRDRCSYSNAWDRRDVGTAAFLPVIQRVVLREVRIAAERDPEGAWRLGTLSIRDGTGPSYGPVRIGAAPIKPR